MQETIPILHQRIRACTRCVIAGYLPVAGPVVSGHRDNQVMLIGQAPGLVEEARRVPFQGRSGKLLMRWLARAGYPDESTARRHVYMTAITKCFPGKSAGSSGDRRPSRAEVELCRPWLDQELALLRPAVIVLVGGLAHERFLPGRPLSELAGRVFSSSGKPVSLRTRSRPVLVPLPHPSGASRWLNDPSNRVLVDRALDNLRLLVRAYLPKS